MNIVVIFNRTEAKGSTFVLETHPYSFGVQDSTFGMAVLSSRIAYGQSKTYSVCAIGGFNIQYGYTLINNQEIIDKINSITTSDELVAYFNSDELLRQEILKIIDMLEQIHSDLVELSDYQIVPYEYKDEMEQEFVNTKGEIHLDKFLSPSLCVNNGKTVIKICRDIEISADSLVGLGNPQPSEVDAQPSEVDAQPSEVDAPIKQPSEVDYKYLYPVFHDLLCIINNKVNKYMYRTTAVKSAR